jgi:hypothetical protein
MRLRVNGIKNTSITDREYYYSMLFSLYLNKYNPLMTIWLFSSFYSCSHHFKEHVSLTSILRHCQVFGACAPKFLLCQRIFYVPRSSLDPALRLNLNALNEEECKKSFRFGHSDIKKILVQLQLPDVIITPEHKDRVLVVEGLCLVLRRLSYPCRWFDLQYQFGRHVSALSRVFYYVMHLILQKVKHGLFFYNASRYELNMFANAFALKGVPNALSLFGVIDTKKHYITKPTRHQRSMYSGHKRQHCVKYQTLEAPNGLIIHCSTGDDGRRGDGYILRRSGLINVLRGNVIFLGFKVLGDSAYPNNDVIVSVYKGHHLPPAFGHALSGDMKRLSDIGHFLTLKNK